MLEQLQKVESPNQGTISDTRSQSAGNSPDLLWLAGFLDGEGSFYFAVHRYKSWIQLHPVMSVANTHFPSIERVRSILAAHGIACYVSPPFNTKSGTPAIAARIEGVKRLIRAIPVILPHLFTRREQASLVLEFCQSRLSGRDMKRGYTEREMAIHERVASLNKRRKRLRDYTRPPVRVEQKPLGTTGRHWRRLQRSFAWAGEDIVRTPSETSESAAEMPAPVSL